MSGTRRRWFQFHLATALILMLGAGGLMYVNFKIQNIATPIPWLVEQRQGWPFEYFAQWKEEDSDFHFFDDGFFLYNHRYMPPIISIPMPPGFEDRSAASADQLADMMMYMKKSSIYATHKNKNSYIAFNAEACFGILILVGIVCEFILRRIPPRKTRPTESMNA